MAAEQITEGKRDQAEKAANEMVARNGRSQPQPIDPHAPPKLPQASGKVPQVVLEVNPKRDGSGMAFELLAKIQPINPKLSEYRPLSPAGDA